MLLGRISAFFLFVVGVATFSAGVSAGIFAIVLYKSPADALLTGLVCSLLPNLIFAFVVWQVGKSNDSWASQGMSRIGWLIVLLVMYLFGFGSTIWMYATT